MYLQLNSYISGVWREHWLNDPSATLRDKKVLNPANSGDTIWKDKTSHLSFLLLEEFFNLKEV